MDRIRELLRRRGGHVPVAYLVGEREFFSLPFHVGPGVLVPRPETELLVEIALAFLRERPAPRFADVGTGSGCIAVALLHALPAAHAHGVDVSEVALAVAARNAERHGVEGRLVLHHGRGLAPLGARGGALPLDAVLSNPPYVLSSDETVEEGVRRHEPPEALFVPGEDPLEVAAEVAREAWAALRPGGLLALEIGAGSGAAAERLLVGLGYEAVEVRPDLARIPRVAIGRRPASG